MLNEVTCLEEMPKYHLQFNMTGKCGVGDCIAWTTAVQWTIENYPNHYGYIVVPKFFVPLAKTWFRKYAPRFVVRDHVTPGIGMLVIPGGAPNANGFHMIEVGFMFFCNRQVPEGWFKYPYIKGDEIKQQKMSRFRLPKDYVVFTPGATAPNKSMRPDCINAMIDVCLERGLKPVFLGKKQVEIAYQAEFNHEINYKAGINLIDHTDLLEAAVIMANARAVTGLDSGLTNLAACSDVPLLLGLTISDLQIPPRPDGGLTVLVEPPLDLWCRYCSKNLRFTDKKTTQCYTERLDCIKLMGPELYRSKFIELLERIV